MKEVYRVRRGSSWFALPQYARGAFRGRSAPYARYNNLGFRVARSPVQRMAR